MAAALDELGGGDSGSELVLGPAADGGFYLIGATRLPDSLLQVTTHPLRRICRCCARGSGRRRVHRYQGTPTGVPCTVGG